MSMRETKRPSGDIGDMIPFHLGFTTQAIFLALVAFQEEMKWYIEFSGQLV